MGETFSSDFPVTSGAFRAADTSGDVFFTKLDSTGSRLIYSTAIGGGLATGVAVGPEGNALVAGSTGDGSYPTTPGALQRTCGPCGGSQSQGGFLSKINPGYSRNASLVYSTYLSGSQTPSPYGATSDLVFAVASDSAGRAILTGGTTASDFPVTSSAFQAHSPGGGPAAFVTVIDPTLSGSSQLVYSTYFGPTGPYGPDTWGNAVLSDSNGKLYFGGYTQAPQLPTSSNAFASECLRFGEYCGSGFVAVLNPQAAPADQLVYGTYVAGTATLRNDDAVTALGLDSYGRIYAAGHTFSASFPVTPDAVQPTCISCPVHQTDLQGNQGFLTVLDPSRAGADQLVYSTYLGGSNFDGVTALAMGPSGEVALAGYSSSPDFPVESNAFQSVCRACRNVSGDQPYSPYPFALLPNYTQPGRLYGDAFVSLFQF